MVPVHGFALVHLDVRGTGASTGTWRNANTTREFADCKQVMDWIVEQPWSDGNVLTWGISYLGLTAEFAAIHGHPALKGVMPMHDYWDVLADVGAPGGVPNVRFLDLWSRLGKVLDRYSARQALGVLPLLAIAVQNVKAVDGDRDRSLLARAVRDHEQNVYPYDLAATMTYRDDPIDADGSIIASMSVYTYMDAIQRGGVPYYAWASWLDAGTADAALHRFANLQNPQRVVIGDWNHGAFSRANPFLPRTRRVVPGQAEQHDEWFNFMDRCLAGEVPDEKVIYYYTLVEDAWKRTTAWPPANHQLQVWYLDGGNALVHGSPGADDGVDAYCVDFSATTGKFNRWAAGLGNRITYPDRARQDKRLLVYTSPPLAGDMEITGNAVATLHLSSTHEDGVVIVYLEDVSPGGRVTYITEGLLRLIHRKPAGDRVPYASGMQFHTYLRADGTPMKPGEIASITIGLHATSTLVRKGHAIRLAIAGADKDSLARIPATGTPVLAVHRGGTRPSGIQLPVVPRGG